MRVRFVTIALVLLVAAVAEAQGPAPAEERLRVPVDASTPQRGPSDALVTIVEFSDFQCPFCSRVQATLAEVQQRYGRDVRIVWRNLPLPFHQDAQPAAEAALAAHAAGRFWSMHDLLFQNQRALDRTSLEQYAAQVGLDPVGFREALDRRRYRTAVEADAKLAGELGITGTPSFVINGRKLVGAQPVDAFAAMIDEELARARKLMAERHVARADVYRELQRGAVARVAKPAPAPAAAAPSVEPGRPDPAVVYKVPVGRSPVKGRPTAKLTVVVFSDFQCPFCGRVNQTLDELEQKFGADVRFVFKHNPLAFHQQAALAAEASLAAHAQGKFWRMHDKLFRNQQQLDRAALEVYAEEIGLDLRRFAAALDQHTYKKDVAEDQKLAAQLGARGTPTFFINGRVLVGAMPLDAFVKLCDEELKRAEGLLRKGTRAHKLYEALIAKGEAGPKRAPVAGAAGADEPRLKVEVLPRDPALGPRNAKVTLVVFSDFQCPFCSRLAPTLHELRKRYPRDLRVVFKQLPLAFHQHAALAGEASLAAHAQGKFWEMHDKLFAEQRALDRDSLHRYAQELGLNFARFQRALDEGTYRAQVAADAKHAEALGIRGTPTMVINGRKLSGARSADDIAAVIDEEKVRKPGKKK